MSIVRKPTPAPAPRTAVKPAIRRAPEKVEPARVAAKPALRSGTVLAPRPRVPAPAPRATAKPTRRAPAPVAPEVVKRRRIIKEGVDAELGKPIKQKLSLKELFESIAEDVTKNPKTESNPRQVKAVLDSFIRHVYRTIAPGGLGKFVYPAVFTIESEKVAAKKVAARKAGEYPNPFKGGALEWREAKPAFVKPATVKVKMRAQRKLKNAALGE